MPFHGPMRQPIRTRHLALLVLAGCVDPAPAPSPLPAPAEFTAPAGASSGVETITAADIYARVSFLASDALRGRDTPSPGLEAAAAYLVAEYRRLGLEPAGEDGTYYQRYPLQTFALDTSSVHLGTIRDDRTGNEMLAYGADFFAVPGGGRPGTDMNHGRLVYAGTLGEAGLPGGEYAGAIPIVSIPGPYSRAWRAEVARARRAARSVGATGVVVALDPAFPAGMFRQLAADSRKPQLSLVEEGEIPVFYVTDRAFRGIAAREPGILEKARSGTAAPFRSLGAHFAANLRVLQDARPPNVVAVLRGSDPTLRDEYVVLSAHMDHVGVGEPVRGDSIYNGADDDASGTSGILEVAEAMASLPTKPRRSVLFLHVSGEEKGLLGSRWYADHPTVPLERIVANINVDMIGRNAPDSVVVIGKKYSSLGRTADQVQARHPELHLTVSDDLWPEERFFFRSDHFNFARREVPSIFFFSGVHEDYHRPSDEVERLNVDKAARIAKMIFYTAQEIANDPERPRWDPRGLMEVRALTR